MPPLTIQNAEIKTATVQIQTLTISGKQVTLAVFRQLREEPLIADDGTLNGVPWGIVNYHPDKCGDDPPHWHIVWQRGTELLRAQVYGRPKFGPYDEWSRHAWDGFQWGNTYYQHEAGSTSKFEFEFEPSPDEMARWREIWSESNRDAKIREARNAALRAAKAPVLARHAEICKPFADLPQLFIAV